MEIFEKGEGRAGQGRVFWIDNIKSHLGEYTSKLFDFLVDFYQR